MKIKFAILFLLTSFFGFSQNMESMKIEVQKMYDLTIAKKYDAIMDFTYPKLFEIIPKNDMLDVMNQIFDNENMTMTFEKVNPEFTFSEIFQIDGDKYCLVMHNNKMTMKFKQDLGENKALVLQSLKESMIDYTVSLDEKTNTFIMNGRAKMIAISDKLTNGTWKYLNFNGDSPMIKKVLAPKVIEKLGL